MTWEAIGPLLYLWLKAAHIIFVIFWVAGLFLLPRYYIYHQEAAPGSRRGSALGRARAQAAQHHHHPVDDSGLAARPHPGDAGTLGKPLARHLVAVRVAAGQVAASWSACPPITAIWSATAASSPRGERPVSGRALAADERGAGSRHRDHRHAGGGEAVLNPGCDATASLASSTCLTWLWPEHNASKVVYPAVRAGNSSASSHLQICPRGNRPDSHSTRVYNASQRLEAAQPGRIGGHGGGARRRRRLDPAQAGADVLDPQDPAEARRTRSWAWARSRSCPTASASCARPIPTISPAPTTSTCRPTRSASSASGPATPSTARSAAPRRASAISASSGSPRSISTIPTPSATASISTI